MAIQRHIELRIEDYSRWHLLLVLVGGMLSLIGCRSAESERLTKINTPTPQTVEVTRIFEVVVTQVVTPIPVARPTRLPTEPSYQPDFEQFQPKLRPCHDAGNLTTLELSFCAAQNAYESARELDKLVRKLDRQLPTWETDLYRPSRLMLWQEEWDNGKLIYCKLRYKENLGGTMLKHVIPACIDEQNQARYDYLEYVACKFLDGFEWDCEDVELDTNSELNFFIDY